ncbi:MAG: hypothetical protein SNH94_02970 [Rikenellaceae bacterium]
MKKRFLYIGIAAATVVGCTEKSDFVTQEPAADLLTVTVSASSEGAAQSRVALTENEDGGLKATWADENETLGAWSSAASTFAKFTMVAGSLSTNNESASFVGENPNGTMRLVHPYVESAAISAEGIFTADVANQAIDITADGGLSSLRGSTYMVSESFESSESVVPSMSQLGAVVEVGLRFSGLAAGSTYQITKLLVGGNSGINLPTQALINLNKEEPAEMVVTEQAGTITAEVSGSPIIGNYADNSLTYSIHFNTFAFDLPSDGQIMLGVELTNEESQRESIVYKITNNSASAYAFGVASYTAINYFCSVEVVAGGSIGDWGELDQSTDLSLSEYDGAMSIPLKRL